MVWRVGPLLCPACTLCSGTSIRVPRGHTLPSETWMNIEAFKICLLCIAYIADNESSHQPFDFCDEEGHGSHAGMQICAIKCLASAKHRFSISTSWLRSSGRQGRS